ncbi:MAG: hypothetical protein Q9162_000614 [Coniocarpon cinnabarinum]
MGQAKPNSQTRKKAGAAGQHQQGPPAPMDVPYRIASITATKPAKPSRKRKRATTASKSDSPKGYLTEHNKHDARLSIHYRVVPKQGAPASLTPWDDLRSKQAFRAGRSLFKIGDFVLISNGETTADIPEDQDDDDDEYWDRFWVGQILEIRFVDSSHVYCRVWWFYRPEEVVGGRQPHHGSGEVFLSNHMEIIDATSVGCITGVSRINENSLVLDGPASGYTDLFWRYAVNVLSRRGSHQVVLDQPKNICVCQQPSNPDWGPVFCNDTRGCGRWMHTECIESDVARRLHEREKQATSEKTTPKPAGFLNRLSSVFRTHSKEDTSTKANGQTSAASGKSAQSGAPNRQDDISADAAQRFDVELRRAPVGTDSEEPLRATVTSAEDVNGQRSTEEVVHCLFCQETLQTQIYNVMLKPFRAWEVEEDGEAAGANETTEQQVRVMVPSPANGPEDDKDGDGALDGEDESGGEDGS